MILVRSTPHLVPSQHQSFIFKKDVTTPYLLLLVILMVTLFTVDGLVVQNVQVSVMDFQGLSLIQHLVQLHTGPMMELAIELLL